MNDYKKMKISFLVCVLCVFFAAWCTVKPVLSGKLKKDKTKVLMGDGS